MKHNKLLIIFLLLALVIPYFDFISVSHLVYADTSSTVSDNENSDINYNQYYYNQLDENSKKIYEAMYQMYVGGIFKTGTEDYDLEANGYVTQEQIKSYANGNSDLLIAMGNARDAFHADHPEIFYVDFSYLSLRATRDSSGKYHAYLGTGRSDNYFTEGFTSKEQVESAIEEFNQKLDALVQEAQNITVEEGQNKIEKQIEYVHNKIINTTSYRMEGLCDEGNDGHIRTSYGPLVKGQAVCEGYARAMKVVLDKLNIPCVIVQGIVRWSESVSQMHMWNYVQVDGAWYGVDATWDDPVDPTGDISTQGIDGFENSEYLLVSEPIMNKNHVESGVMSSAGFEFTYPELSDEELGFNTIIADRGLTVKYKEDGKYEDLEAGEFKVSYNGMGYAKAAETGKYILGKFYQYDAETDSFIDGGWGYLDTELYSESEMMEDSDTEITLRLPHVQYVEFAVTDIAPKDKAELIANYGAYTGDPLLFEAQTEKIYNKNGTYTAPPYIESITPTTSGRLKIGKTYNVTVKYDCALKLIEGEEAGFHVSASNSTAAQNCKIDNFKWDEDRTFTFDFTPSEMWADDTELYEISITGVVGQASGKAPNSISYIASHGCVAYAYRSQGYDWNAFGKPSLLENSDLSTTNWVTNDGTKVTDKLTNQIALVTTSTTKAQDEVMNEMIEEKIGDTLACETYNISLTLCKSQVIKTGQAVRVSVGFPEGYSAEDEGVTYKAYHFTKNAQGEIISTEEIGCVVTKYGLVITCDAFSPFAIVAVEGDSETTANADKSIIVSNTTGGKIEGSDSLFTLKEGESQDIKIVSDEGYQIESISVDGVAREIDNTDFTTITVKYDDFATETGIVDIKFVAKSVAEAEEERNESAVIVEPENLEPSSFTVSITSDEEKLIPGAEFKLNVILNNFKNIENGLMVFTGQLDYDKSVIEFETFNGYNGWEFDENSINEENLKFITENDGYMTEADRAFSMALKIKDDVEAPSEVTIKIKNISAANGIKDIYAESAEITLDIEKEITDITSEKYTKDGEYITKILPETTIAEFKANITPKENIVIEDKDGNVIDDESKLVATGMKVKLVDSDIEYVLVVKGDTDGDGKITIGDLAQIKLHCIDVEILEGARFKAGDLDDNGNVTVNDVAQIKLIIIGEMELK